VYWSPATGAHVVDGPVKVKWGLVGAERGVLGFPTQDVAATPDGRGQFGRFTGGSIYSTPTTGSWVLLGPIETLWRGTGAETGLLGYPTQSVSTTPDRKGQYAKFEHGSIYWTPTTGARAMLGAVETRWLADGAQAGKMGYPTQSVSNLPGGGQYARFQGGSIYWSAATGAWEVRGAFLAVWAGGGAEHGALGYPIGEPYAVNGGQWQKFQHGYVAHSTATGKTWAVRQ
jgi:uncharacterized protein with LGFP repeats